MGTFTQQTWFLTKQQACSHPLPDRGPATSSTPPYQEFPPPGPIPCASSTSARSPAILSRISSPECTTCSLDMAPTSPSPIPMLTALARVPHTDREPGRRHNCLLLPSLKCARVECLMVVQAST